MQHTAIFHARKNDNFHLNFFYYFLIFAQNIDCGYTLDNVYPCKPQFYYIKVGCKGVFITRTCFRDVSTINVKIVYDTAFASSVDADKCKKYAKIRN